MTGNGGGMGFRDSFGPKFGNYGMSYPVERLPFPVDAERLAVLGEVLTHLVTILTFIWNDVVKQFQTGSGLSERDDPGSKQYGMQWNDPLSVLALQLFIATVIDIQAPGNRRGVGRCHHRPGGESFQVLRNAKIPLPPRFFSPPS